MHADTPALADAKTILYLGLPTYAEFLAASPQRSLLTARQHEVRLDPEDQAYFVHYADEVRLLVITTADSPDAVAVLPIWARIAAASPHLDLRVIGDDEAPTVLPGLVDDAETVLGWVEAALPLVLVFDELWHLHDHWGPRPHAADANVEQWLAAHPEFEAPAEDESAAGQQRYFDLLAQLTHAMRLWYNSGLNRACVQEARALLAALHDDLAGEEAEE